MMSFSSYGLRKTVVVTNVDGCRETVQDDVHERIMPASSPPTLVAAVTDLFESSERRARLIQ